MPEPIDFQPGAWAGSEASANGSEHDGRDRRRSGASTGPPHRHAPARVEARGGVRDRRDDDRTGPECAGQPPPGWIAREHGDADEPEADAARREPVARSLGTSQNARTATKIGTDAFATAATPESMCFSPQAISVNGIAAFSRPSTTPSRQAARSARSPYRCARTRRGRAPRTAGAPRSAPPAGSRARRP